MDENYQISTLENGLRVITAEMPQARSVTASIVVGTGSRSEDYQVNGGVSHFLEHLLFKGTTKRPSAKIISEEIDSVGGYNNAYTSNEVTNYYIKVPKEHSRLAIDILADMVTDSLLDPAEVDRERSVVLEEMNVYRDDPARFVGELIPGLLWPDHPLGREVIGSDEVIATIKRDDIMVYKRLHYSADNMVVAVAGKVKHEKIVDQVREAMASLGPKRQPKPLRVGESLSTRLATPLIKDTAQAHFVIGCRAFPFMHKDDPAAKIVTSILGRGMSSRLFINVRERKGLAYSVYANISNFLDSGIFEAYAGVNLDKMELALEAVLDELLSIQSEPVSELELAKAKNQLRGGLEMAMEANNNVADRIGTQLVLLNRVQSVEDELAAIEAVTVADVARVAKKMLDPANLRLGIIAPAASKATKKFESLLAKL